MSNPKKRVAILISGRGSNMRSLIGAMREADFPAEPAVVIANRPEALGLSWAEEQGIPAIAIDQRQFANRMAFEARLHEALLAHGSELICLAGFMRILTGGFVDRWLDRLMNIHPSLLPLFPGLHTHRRAIDSGALITGCTVHFVRTEMDSGPILAQAAVAVLPGDTEETLSARVLEAEHRIYPLALNMVASGRVRIENETAHFSGPFAAPPPLIVPQLAHG
ncbi:MAG: phosphoribosylglycinamide formyltransferase [Hyphomicrobiaceae bacterium]|nr:MAG: phosphoribosylglycinamide formyltransferase [Hyphomicrobiaceae bacterium]